MEEDSIENTLKSVRRLIKSPQKYSLSDQEVLELTEDDIYDELDEDYQDPDNNSKINEKISNVNQFLTTLENNNYNCHSSVERNEDSDSEMIVSKEIAAKSAAHLRNIIKKMELPIEKKSSIHSKLQLEQVIFESLKPYLEEWLEQNVSNLVRKELQSAKLKQNREDI